MMRLTPFVPNRRASSQGNSRTSSDGGGASSSSVAATASEVGQGLQLGSGYTSLGSRVLPSCGVLVHCR